MLERTVKHPIDRFARCRTCGAEPKHIESQGRSSREPVQFAAAGTRHILECQKCGARTSRAPTLEAAEREWGRNYAQLALPLQIRARRNRRAA